MYSSAHTQTVAMNSFPQDSRFIRYVILVYLHFTAQNVKKTTFSRVRFSKINSFYCFIKDIVK